MEQHSSGLRQLPHINHKRKIDLLPRANSKRIKDIERLKQYESHKEQRKAAYRYIRETSFNDAILMETVCRVSPDQIAYRLAVVFGQPNPDAIPAVEKGLVLTDSLGRGVFQ